MRILLFLVIFSVNASQLFAQLSVKRYVLLEHFTNSRCGICSFKNPPFYTFLQKYPQDVHHISVHPVFPYNNCIFYQAAKDDNTARVATYGNEVVGTPTWAIGGKNLTQNITESMLTSALGGRSPVSLQVQDQANTGNFSTSILVTNHSALPEGKYKLYAILVEKKVEYNAPNGEKIHHDVLRRILNGKDGSDITRLGAGATTTFSFSGTTLSEWKADQLAVVAFIQNVDTKEVLNSGTRFDPPVTTSSVTANVEPSLAVYPNPVMNQANIRLANEAVQNVLLFNSSGQRIEPVFEQTPEGVRIDTHGLPKGLYLLKITGKGAIYSGKFVKS